MQFLAHLCPCWQLLLNDSILHWRPNLFWEIQMLRLTMRGSWSASLVLSKVNGLITVRCCCSQNQKMGLLCFKHGGAVYFPAAAQEAAAKGQRRLQWESWWGGQQREVCGAQPKGNWKEAWDRESVCSPCSTQVSGWKQGKQKAWRRSVFERDKNKRKQEDILHAFKHSCQHAVFYKSRQFMKPSRIF